MLSGWRTLGIVLGKSVMWGISTAVMSFLLTLAVFLYVVPLLIDAPDLAVLAFAFLMGYGGLFIGLLLGLLLQVPAVLPLSPWHQGLHIGATLLVVALSWMSADIALDPGTLGAPLSEKPAEGAPRS